MDMINQKLQLTYDLELVSTDAVKLKSYVEAVGFGTASTTTDSYQRNLWHLCSLFGNLDGLLYLERFTNGDDNFIKAKDKYGYTCAHFAG